MAVGQRTTRIRGGRLVLAAVLAASLGAVALWWTAPATGPQLPPRTASSAPGPEAPTAGALCAVRGVLRTEGAPAEGVTVHLAREEDLAGTGSSGARETDAQGGFAFESLEAGRYHLWAVVPSHVPGTHPALTCRDGEEPSVIFDLARGDATLSGRLVDRQGAALDGGMVSLAQTDGKDVLPGLARVAAGADGSFELALPPDHSYAIHGQAPGYLRTTQLVDLPPEGARDLSLALAPAVEVHGTVRDATGSGVAATVHVGPLGRANETFAAGDDGTFTARAPGDVDLRVAAVRGEQVGCTPVGILEEGKTIRGIEVRIAQGRTVRGALVDGEGAPVEGEVVRWRERSCGLAGVVTSNAVGRFQLRGLPHVPVEVFSGSATHTVWATEDRDSIVVTHAPPRPR